MNRKRKRREAGANHVFLINLSQNFAWDILLESSQARFLSRVTSLNFQERSLLFLTISVSIVNVNTAFHLNVLVETIVCCVLCVEEDNSRTMLHNKCTRAYLSEHLHTYNLLCTCTFTFMIHVLNVENSEIVQAWHIKHFWLYLS